MLEDKAFIRKLLDQRKILHRTYNNFQASVAVERGMLQSLQNRNVSIFQLCILPNNGNFYFIQNSLLPKDIQT